MSRPDLGIIGAGRVGTALARLAMRSGYRVFLANSRAPESLKLVAEVLTPGATPVTAGEAASRGGLVILALPIRRFRALPVEELAAKVVVDAMNYLPEEDGIFADVEEDSRSSSEIVQGFLTRSRVVKALNHVGYGELEEESLPGIEGRRAFALAGDDPDAKRAIAELISDLGFDSLDAGPLSEGWRFEPGTPAFGGRYTASGLRRALDAATR